MLSFENILGFVLATLIVFDFKVERSIANVINSPVGIVLSMVLLVVMFVFLNPIIGLLFLIYIYETVKYSSSFLAEYVKPVERVRTDLMQKLNMSHESSRDNVEVNVISKMAPIVTVRESPNANFQPSTQFSLKYTAI